VVISALSATASFGAGNPITVSKLFLLLPDFAEFAESPSTLVTMDQLRLALSLLDRQSIITVIWDENSDEGTVYLTKLRLS
jgi:hypothetical protein